MLTEQEMFDRAVRGLRAQGFRKATKVVDDAPVWVHGENREVCTYLAANGDRCAWGHVDPSLTADDKGSVGNLAAMNVGLAAELSYDGLEFARELQRAHDGSDGPADMERRLRSVGREFHLGWPE